MFLCPKACFRLLRAPAKKPPYCTGGTGGTRGPQSNCPQRGITFIGAIFQVRKMCPPLSMGPILRLVFWVRIKVGKRGRQVAGTVHGVICEPFLGGDGSSPFSNQLCLLFEDWLSSLWYQPHASFFVRSPSRAVERTMFASYAQMNNNPPPPSYL